MDFFPPLLEFFGYKMGEVLQYAGNRLTVNVNPFNDVATNIWEAKRNHPFDPYEPGLHHLALNAGSRSQVDDAHRLAQQLGARILDGPGEFPFAHRGYYAVYFLGPDNLKIEAVHLSKPS